MTTPATVASPRPPVAFDANGHAIRTLPAEQSAGSVVAELLPPSRRLVSALAQRPRSLMALMTADVLAGIAWA